MADADWGGQPGSRLGLDIGGTLAKLVFFESDSKPSWCQGRIPEAIARLGSSSPSEEPAYKKSRSSQSFWGERDPELSFVDEELGGRFHFVTFRSDQMEAFVSLVERHRLHDGMREIFTTGGGAYKYASLFRERLGVELRPVDELGVVVKGISWLVERPLDDQLCWLEDSLASSESTWRSECGRKNLKLQRDELFPFILVNIGSGVSIVRVDGLSKFERVSGSAIGGGTFWGLCRLLCPNCTDFGEAGLLAAEGDASSVNLLVEDIYGGDYTLPDGRQLPGSLVASFFAKAATEQGRHHNEAALVQALIKMVAFNICQIAYLNARIHGLKRIVFTGNFLRQNPVAREAIASNMRSVSTAVRAGEPYQALFLKHEGFFGALGSFLHNVTEHRADIPLCRRMASKTAGDDASAAKTLIEKVVAGMPKTFSLFGCWRSCRRRAGSGLAGLLRPPTRVTRKDSAAPQCEEMGKSSKSISTEVHPV